MKEIRFLLMCALMTLASCSGGGSAGGPVNNNDVTLKSLAVSEGTLSPLFSAEVVSYTVEVANAATSVGVTAVTSDANASLKINNETWKSGSASAIAISSAQTAVTILVTSADGSISKSYSLTINRISGVSKNADLSGLVLSKGTLSPSFNANQTSYTVELASDVDSFTVTPTVAGIGASVSVNGTSVPSGTASGNIGIGASAVTVTIVVMAQDGTTSKTYTIRASRLGSSSTNADLSGLCLSSGSLSPAFGAGTISYTAEVGNSVTSITVTPTAGGAGAAIKVNGMSVSSGSASEGISLVTGSNTIRIIVTAQDGVTTKTYTVTVTRLPAAVKEAQWAAPAVSSTSAYSSFGDIAVDGNANVYVTGGLQSGSTINFGNGVSVTAPATTTSSVLVKYDSSGVAKWAKVASCTAMYFYNSVAVDADGNVYAAGWVFGTSEFGFGDGVTVTGVSTSNNMLIVKYSSSGVAQWAKTLVSGGATNLQDIIVGGDGYIYVAGNMTGTGVFSFGGGVNATGLASENNPFIVKYSDAGVPQWAATVTDGTTGGIFLALAMDASGNLFAAGKISGTGTAYFSTKAAAAGTNPKSNALLVKYDSTGTAVWARSSQYSGTASYYEGTQFDSIALDNAGGIYIAGCLEDSGTYTFADGISAAGGECVLIKYGTDGAAKWVREPGGCGAELNDVSVDANGNIFVAGDFGGSSDSTCEFGNSVSLASLEGVYLPLLVQYNSAGDAQWAKTIQTTKPSSVQYYDAAAYYSLALDGSGNVYVAGSVAAGTHVFSSGVSLTAIQGPLVVKYK